MKKAHEGVYVLIIALICLSDHSLSNHLCLEVFCKAPFFWMRMQRKVS